ncbi:MAG: hypothetical protein PWR22_1219 [Moorella sp. (in: firmicutes)]|nr:hypothetical protein [Moorella sp. (in: firmicutes)]
MRKLSFAGQVAARFINSKLTPLLIIATVLMGLMAVLTTPREEEPQIKVPMIDIMVAAPGARVEEVETKVSKPLEKLMWEVEGVEYVYSTSRAEMALVTVRFKVGSEPEASLVKVYNKIFANMDRMPPGVTQPLIKLKSIDDVPIVTLTLWSQELNDYQLRKIALVLEDELKKIANVGETKIYGGRPRQVSIYLDAGRLAAYNLTPLDVTGVLQQANSSLVSGSFNSNNSEIKVRTGEFFQGVEDVANLLITVADGRPVYLRDIAEVKDGPAEVTNYVFFGLGPHPEERDREIAGSGQGVYPAVTISVSKKKGTNAVAVADEVIAKVENLRGRIVPANVGVTVTRDYGETAAEKSNELIKHLLIATLSVTVLIGITLGLRAGIIIAITVPVTLAIALFLSKLFGYTLNRVTLFALIFAIGILVDDAIVVIENIHRWFTMKRRHDQETAVLAVDEVGNSTILATFTVIAVLLPMAFVTGLMGPYMSPIPINASVAMFFSLLVAFIVTPWAAYRLLRQPHNGAEHQESSSSPLAGRYSLFMRGLLHSAGKRNLFLGGVVFLLLIAFGMIAGKLVTFKMLPFDNKSEVEIVIDMPEGATLEETSKVTLAIGDYLKTVEEVTNFQLYAGIPAPFNFNGLVRHYYLREGSNVADIQVNLLPKHDRRRQSHDIAKAIRPEVQRIAAQYGANAKVVEVPPGPPVLSTLVAEIYGENLEEQVAAASKVKEILVGTPGVVDVDWFVNDDQTQYHFAIKDKVRASGISEDQIVRTIRLLLSGYDAGALDQSGSLEGTRVVVRAPKTERTSLAGLLSYKIRNAAGQLVPLAELVEPVKGLADKQIDHKNLQRVIYVVADVAGKEESPVYAMLAVHNKIKSITSSDGQPIKIYFTRQPENEKGISLKWDGEWQITYEVFRDLGLAFAVGLIVMYLLIVGWFQSFVVPIVIMSPIPLTLTGIIPGHLLLGAFFTATSMIGFIALAGIIVRNSILLVEFAKQRTDEGLSLEEAVIDAGIVRAKPILLTAAAVMVGSFVILFDPIFQGMAISLIFGTLLSTTLTLFVVPLLYYLVMSRRSAARRSTELDLQKGETV